MVAIIDCNGFKLKTFNKYVREVLKQAAAITDPNYPEALGLCVVINAPWFVKVRGTENPQSILFFGFDPVLAFPFEPRPIRVDVCPVAFGPVTRLSGP